MKGKVRHLPDSHLQTLLEWREASEKRKYMELLANTVIFISCRLRVTKVLAGASREKKGSKGAGGRVRLSDVDTRRLQTGSEEVRMYWARANFKERDLKILMVAKVHSGRKRKVEKESERGKEVKSQLSRVSVPFPPC